MRSIVKSTIQSLLALVGLRLVRGPENRFDAMRACLQHLRNSGYAPSIIIDGGAHIGSFSRLAHDIFPAAMIHMIEPQKSCRPYLAALHREFGFVHLEYALSDKTGVLPMVTEEMPDSGAYLPWTAETSKATTTVEVSTLDYQFAEGVHALDRTLLKLDLQCHEFPALQGGLSLLRSVEVVIVELSFFHHHSEIPLFEDMVLFFKAQGFRAYDVAALSGRTGDNRLKQADFVFVRRDSQLLANDAWG